MHLSWSLNNLSAFLLDMLALALSSVRHTTRLPRLVPVSARLLCVWNSDWVNLPTGLLNVYIHVHASGEVNRSKLLLIICVCVCVFVGVFTVSLSSGAK